MENAKSFLPSLPAASTGLGSAFSVHLTKITFRVYIFHSTLFKLCSVIAHTLKIGRFEQFKKICPCHIEGT